VPDVQHWQIATGRPFRQAPECEASPWLLAPYKRQSPRGPGKDVEGSSETAGPAHGDHP